MDHTKGLQSPALNAISLRNIRKIVGPPGLEPADLVLCVPTVGRCSACICIRKYLPVEVRPDQASSNAAPVPVALVFFI
jgi:hypothetical protein